MPAMLLTACALALPVPAPDPADLAQLVQTAARDLAYEDGAFSGPGYDWLVSEASRAHFTLLGESHGNRETPALTRALLADLRPAGYAAYAIESGPWSTEWFVESARADGEAAIATLTRRYPLSIAFLNWRDEADTVLAALDHDYAVWGIDQEFIACGRLLTRQLVDLAPDDEARTLAQRWNDRAEDGFRTFVEKGDQSQGFMVVVTDPDFDELDRAFTDGPEEARAILSALRASATVYRHYAEGRYFENNRDRIRLMKRTLVDHLDRAGHPRTLIKIGSAHAGRGYSPFDQLDVGNLAAELGFAQGHDSFHVYVFARRSVAADGSTKDFADGTPELRPFYDQLGDTPRVFDLRPLRAWASAHAERDPELHTLAFRYDAVLLLPELHAAEDLVPLPGGGR